MRRPDCEELLAIRVGRFTHEDLMKKVAQELLEVYADFSVCQLPPVADVQQIECWVIEIRRAWYCR